MEAAFTMLNDLDVMKDDCVIRVRIIRVWRQADRRTPSEDYSLEMIFIDENGNKIQANVFKRWFFRFERYLQDNACLIIKKPGIGINSATYKFSENPNKLCLNPNTHISPCTDFKGPEFGFQFVPFQAIKNNDVPQNVTIDIIGHITKFFKNDSKDNKDANGKKRLTMEIEDLEGHNIYVTIWDQYADVMSKYVSSNPNEEHVVMILQFARLKFFKGSPYVSNSYGFDITRLCINEDVEEIKTYKKNLLGKSVAAPSSSRRPYGADMFSSLQDEFLTNTKFSHIGDIWEINAEQFVVVLGTIKAICKDVGWYYMGCPKCTRKVAIDYKITEKADGSGEFEEEKVYECINVKCKENFVLAIPRIRIQIRVQDINGAVSLTLFHRDVTHLMNKSAQQFLDENTANDTVTFPKDLNSLVDKMFAFKIEVTEYNLKNNYEVYGISKLTSDDSIISALIKKYNIGQPNESESMSVSLSEIQPHDVLPMKDSISGTADNVTPLCNTDKVLDVDDSIGENTCSINSKYQFAKRKLVDVYDLEETAHMATSFNGDEVNKVKASEGSAMKLLIPKTEK